MLGNMIHMDSMASQDYLYLYLYLYLFLYLYLNLYLYLYLYLNLNLMVNIVGSQEWFVRSLCGCLIPGHSATQLVALMMVMMMMMMIIDHDDHDAKGPAS